MCLLFFFSLRQLDLNDSLAVIFFLFHDCVLLWFSIVVLSLFYLFCVNFDEFGSHVHLVRSISFDIRYKSVFECVHVHLYHVRPQYPTPASDKQKGRCHII